MSISMSMPWNVSCLWSEPQPLHGPHGQQSPNFNVVIGSDEHHQQQNLLFWLFCCPPELSWNCCSLKPHDCDCDCNCDCDRPQRSTVPAPLWKRIHLTEPVADGMHVMPHAVASGWNQKTRGRDPCKQVCKQWPNITWWRQSNQNPWRGQLNMPLHCAVTFQNHKNVVTWWWCRELTLMFKTLRVRGWKVWDTWKIDCDTVTQWHYDCDTDNKELTVTSSEQLTVKFPVQWSRPDEKAIAGSNMSKPQVTCQNHKNVTWWQVTSDKWQLTLMFDVQCSPEK